MDQMDQNCVIEHAHEIDAPALIEKYRQQGYELIEEAEPTIVAQAGYKKYVFLPKELAALRAPIEPPVEETRMAKAKKRFLSHFLKPHVAD